MAITSELRHAWFSEQAANLHGSHIYQMPGGGTIETTLVSEDPDADLGYCWDDKVYIGLVSDFVSQGRTGTFMQEKFEKKLNNRVKVVLDGSSFQLEEFARKLLGDN